MEIIVCLILGIMLMKWIVSACVKLCLWLYESIVGVMPVVTQNRVRAVTSTIVGWLRFGVAILIILIAAEFFF